MGLRLIIGRSGTGKTETCMREIAERQGKQNDVLFLCTRTVLFPGGTGFDRKNKRERYSAR